DEQFPGVRKVMVIRHPFAVAVSKKRNRSWKWMEDPRALLKQPDLMRDHLDPFRELLEASHRRFERQVLLWCIFHYVPRRELSRERVHLTFYEELCEDPEPELARLFAYLGQPLDRELDPRLRAQLKNTFQVTARSAIVTGGDLTGSWQRYITSAQYEAGMAILRVFGLEPIYGQGLRPDRCAAEALLGAG
ncbi:hypothetical protein DYH09_13205, partial [bacterium CPR1]|nr:hypothetical protein [bacterium CPR1]